MSTSDISLVIEAVTLILVILIAFRTRGGP